MSLKFISLIEAPIGDIHFVGDWADDAKPRGYDKASIGILKSPTGLEKMRTKWGKTWEEFDIYFLRSPRGKRGFEVGEVSPKFVREQLDIKDFSHDPDRITVIYTNNYGSEKMPMTPWTLAHRLGHAMFRGTSYFMQFITKLESVLNTIASVVYGQNHHIDYSEKRKIFLPICQMLGTMKSARDKNLRNYFEFVYELFAQFLITGEVNMKTEFDLTLPKYYTWGRPQGPYRRQLSDSDKDRLKQIVDSFASWSTNFFTTMLSSSVGKVYSM